VSERESPKWREKSKMKVSERQLKTGLFSLYIFSLIFTLWKEEKNRNRNFLREHMNLYLTQFKHCRRRRENCRTIIQFMHSAVWEFILFHTKFQFSPLRNDLLFVCYLYHLRLVFILLSLLSLSFDSYCWVSNLNLLCDRLFRMPSFISFKQKQNKTWTSKLGVVGIRNWRRWG